MIETVEIDNLVIGAGVVGLATAAAIARQGKEVFVIDRGSVIGNGISSRNSEVIHSGIYYPTGSLRHLACIEGRDRLYEYCASRKIPFSKCGKIVVATDEQEVVKLNSIFEQATRNGVHSVSMLDRKELQAKEPLINGIHALFCPDTGIIDSHSYMQSLMWEIEESGGAVLLNHEVIGGELSAQRKSLLVSTPEGQLHISANHVVLCAGPWSHAVLSRVEHDLKTLPPVLRLAKGSYFSCSQRLDIRHLIYPVPVNGGLGTHLTLDLAGMVRFGPDVEWLEHNDPDGVDFNVHSERGLSFYDAIRRYLPSLSDGALITAYSGVRPKLADRSEPNADFLLLGEEDTGVDGLAAFFGIESPGLTASLSLADRVLELLDVH